MDILVVSVHSFADDCSSESMIYALTFDINEFEWVCTDFFRSNILFVMITHILYSQSCS